MKISAVDNGPGIPPEDKDKIFKEFVQVDTSYARKYSGTGLGFNQKTG
ncbi:MAG TPA: hypothetical protein DHV62_10580 [Elusimicrobia bacterium]|nr:hypothetical protein [Elusimicrobiota bacterium]